VEILKELCGLMILGVLGFGLSVPDTVADPISQQGGDRLQRKIDAVRENGSAERTAPKKTPVTESEVNSYLKFNVKDQIPRGLTRPQIHMLGHGRLAGRILVDIDEFKRHRVQGGVLDPFNYISGNVPVTAGGILRTGQGKGQFQLESAEILGLPLPKPLLQELVSFFSRSPERPNGLDIDTPFDLPAKIREIEIGKRVAIVVQ
jgi:hypothetical protein